MDAISRAFDTHDAVRRLERAGSQSPQAEAITETVRLLDDAQRDAQLGQLTTKADLLELEGRIIKTMYAALFTTALATIGLTVALIKLL